MTRLLCMRLGTGLSGATLATCILRGGSPRPQADMWSSGAGANVQMLRAREIVVAGVAAVNDADQPTPEVCREVAQQLTQMAEQARLPEIKADLLELAERFERMAVLFEV